jgi:hypothetical protein
MYIVIDIIINLIIIYIILFSMLYIIKQFDSLNNQHAILVCDWVVIRHIENNNYVRWKLDDVDKAIVSFNSIKWYLSPWDKEKIEALEKRISLF